MGERAVALQAGLAEGARQLQEALARVRQIGQLPPICASCQRGRGDGNSWHAVEASAARQVNGRMIGAENRLHYAAVGSVANLASRLCDRARGIRSW